MTEVARKVNKILSMKMFLDDKPHTCIWGLGFLAMPCFPLSLKKVRCLLASVSALVHSSGFSTRKEGASGPQRAAGEMPYWVVARAESKAAELTQPLIRHLLSADLLILQGQQS